MGHEAVGRAAGWQDGHTPLLVLGFLVLGLGLPLAPLAEGAHGSPALTALTSPVLSAYRQTVREKFKLQGLLAQIHHNCGDGQE